MITNTGITIYHRINNKWERKYYSNCWYYSKSNASLEKGYNVKNSVEVRIPYKQNKISIKDVKIEDIIVKGNTNKNITSLGDLKGYSYYSITSLTDNSFGQEPHIHIGAN